ncbi:zinc-binding oxidoreductase CipB [Podospora didyma]|uniref:Zinc-binding oxidoreductase CipB n=1 Tax=Podospora didyma TaxID=330526 RepID=A0AAE0K1M0_9PEZI|nr:zinc-binding oxidoreductase CipB [Podospora didyma]
MASAPLTATPPQNTAAYLVSKNAQPLEVKSAPYTPPAANEIVIQNHAIAVNPVDRGKQQAGNKMLSWIQYPFVLGSDVAGEVVEVGPGVSLFGVGDRVVGHAVGPDKRSNRSAEGAFQAYTVLRTNLAAKIPDSLGYENACVLPLGLSTAACGLFMKEYCGLELPTSTSRDGESKGTFIVWGGSTSVGSNAIQLARAAGYEVFTTASPKNFEYVRGLGASQVFDYHDADTTKSMVAALKDKICVGAIAIGAGSLETCIEVVALAGGGGGKKRFVAQASLDLEVPKDGGALGMVGALAGFVALSAKLAVKAKVKGVTTKFIWGSDLMANEVGKAIWTEFLPAALAEGRYLAKPDPRVVGKGLDKIQEAMEILFAGVSAEKIVVTLRV